VQSSVLTMWVHTLYLICESTAPFRDRIARSMPYTPLWEVAYDVGGLMEKKRQWVHASRNANEGILMFYDAICSYDGKSIQVPFKPDHNRPVYCHDHLIYVRDEATRVDEGDAACGTSKKRASLQRNGMDNDHAADRQKQEARREAQRIRRDDQQAAALAHVASLQGEDRIQHRLNRSLKQWQRKDSDQTREEEWIFAHCSHKA
jgi:CxxC-x17-CxxC domain-containing protein